MKCPVCGCETIGQYSLLNSGEFVAIRQPTDSTLLVNLSAAYLQKSRHNWTVLADCDICVGCETIFT